MTDVNVLIIVGRPADSVDRELAGSGADSSVDGMTVTLFDSLTDLPRYSETLERRGAPRSVEALRTAATQADAVLIVTSHHMRIHAVVHNGIDWLTRRWNQGDLHDKPLAVIGRAAACYSGVWSRQTDDSASIAGSRIIEPIAVSNLREAIKKLACDVRACGALNSASPARLQFG
jgi:NAD(P)H-dependent FMN reductase